MNRVALYARVSSEIQEKEATIESQVALLREAAAKAGDVVVEEYRDDGFSGDLLARPALDRLRDDASRNVFDRVLILSPDRLARKWYLGEVVTDDLRRHGVPIQYLNHKDDGTPESAMMLTIQGAFGQYEKAKIIERSRRGRLYGVRNGRLMMSHSPYGYRYIPKSSGQPSRLEIIEDQASVVRLIFDLYAKGVSLSEIAAELHRRKIPTPRMAPAWVRASLVQMLKSETYAGVWHYNKTIAEPPRRILKPHAIRRSINTSQHIRPRDQWVGVAVPAIVDRETFDAAQRQMERNRRLAARNRHRPYLLAGLCRCGLCGRSMPGTPNNGYMYYRCGGNARFGGIAGPCSHRAMSALKLDAAVWTGISGLLRDPALFIRSVSLVRMKAGSESQAALAEKEALDRQLQQLKISESRIVEAYSSGAIQMDQLREEMRRLRDKRDALTQKAEAAGKDVKPDAVSRESLELLFDKVSAGLDLAERDFEIRQNLVRRLVDSVIVRPGQAQVIGALPASAESPQAPFRTLAPGSLQPRIHNHIIQFELAVAV